MSENEGVVMRNIAKIKAKIGVKISNNKCLKIVIDEINLY